VFVHEVLLTPQSPGLAVHSLMSAHAPPLEGAVYPDAQVQR
jgi:hypothetical protein